MSLKGKLKEEGFTLDSRALKTSREIVMRRITGYQEAGVFFVMVAGDSGPDYEFYTVKPHYRDIKGITPPPGAGREQSSHRIPNHHE